VFEGEASFLFSWLASANNVFFFRLPGFGGVLVGVIMWGVMRKMSWN
jgi:hypothetical protein